MPLDFPDQSEIFVDANIFVYHSNEIKKEFGLLTNDAITLAVMRRHRLSKIATNDPDFDRITDLSVWKPTE